MAFFFSLVVLFLPAYASAASNVETVFTSPFRGLIRAWPDDVIERKIIDYLDRATKGSKFRASLYQAEETNVAKAIVAAARRGVDVELVLDDSNVKKSSSKGFVKILKQGLPAKKIHVCSQGACIAKENNHNKIFTFSEVTAPGNARALVRNIVMVTSMNLSDSQMRQHNNLVIVKDDAGLHGSFENYLDDLFHERRNPDYLNGARGHGQGTGATTVTGYFYPSKGPSEPFLDTLRSASCEDGGEVRVTHSLFRDQYALDVLAQLVRLQKEGCTVGLILRSDSSDNEWIPELDKSGLWVTYVGFRYGSHSKYTLLNANFPDDSGGKVRRRIVFTGSANIKAQSVYENDESILKIEDQSVYEEFLKNWTKIQSEQ